MPISAPTERKRTMKLKVLALLMAAGFALPAPAQELIIGLSHPKTGRYSG